MIDAEHTLFRVKTSRETTALPDRGYVERSLISDGRRIMYCGLILWCMDTKGKGDFPKSTLRFVAEIVLIFGVSTMVVGFWLVFLLDPRASDQGY